ncbi:bifunctional sugar phosphate isomerase/epimerase/4-hydroxyphenylpyruvate dioxygenase family protein [Actinomadura scrupuli]|uniref:bifunctional sugar phosphate isomerase/epimerase/4-hydroxyphenylpyruvate dioxygenase family protein n=1 Tax=Actinomadura scrupuli TaxID=559629 RepID=UPI003D974D35
MRKSLATVCLSGSLTEKLSAAAATGFDGVEIFENDLISCASSPADVRHRAADLGLTIDLYQPFRDLEAVPEEIFTHGLRRAEHKFRVMAGLGATRLLVCSNVSPAAIDDDMLAADQLRRLAERAAEHGIDIAYEALAWGRHVDDYRHAWEIVAAADHPGLGVCLDSFHILSRGSDPAGIRDIPAEKLFFLQLADAPQMSMDVLQWSRHYRCFPGQGTFDLTGFLEHVLAAGYRGPLSLEVFNDVFRQADAERTAVDAMRSLIALEDSLGERLPAVELAALPTPEKLSGFAFVEVAVDPLSEPAAENLLLGMGFAHTGRHRTKPVQLWQQGEASVLLNRAHPADGRWQRGDAALSALAVETGSPGRSAARADALLAVPIPRRTGRHEADLPAITAPDGTSLFFCRTDTAHGTGWLGDFAPIAPRERPEGAGITGIDHVALSQPANHFDEAALFYQSVLGLRPRTNEEIADPYGLVRSRAIADTGGHVRLVINMPLLGGGPLPETSRFQHIALHCTDIFAAAERLRAGRVPSLPIPANYYDDLAARTDLESSLIATMREYGVLYDRSDAGEFFHFYTAMLSRHLFFEIVQRVKDYDGYGAPNTAVRMAAQHRHTTMSGA